MNENQEIKPMPEKKPEKYCPDCKKTKSLEDDFTKDKSKIDGHSLICRTCKNEAQKRYRQEQRQGRSDTKAGKKAAKNGVFDMDKIKAIYIDPPLPPTLEDIAADMARVNYNELTINQEYADDFLSIDMMGHAHIMDRLTEAAIRDLRTPEMQALFILREALKCQGSTTI